jgi:hypothetical protein
MPIMSLSTSRLLDCIQTGKNSNEVIISEMMDLEYPMVYISTNWFASIISSLSVSIDVKMEGIPLTIICSKLERKTPVSTTE